MSYEFLDRLLSKSLFRETFTHWLETYEATLKNNEEDEKTRYFISFIRSCITIKDSVLLKKQNFIRDYQVRVSFDEVKSEFGPKFSQKQPDEAGCYFEVKCAHSECPIFKAKEFV